MFLIHAIKGAIEHVMHLFLCVAAAAVLLAVVIFNLDFLEDSDAE